MNNIKSRLFEYLITGTAIATAIWQIALIKLSNLDHKACVENSLSTVSNQPHTHSRVFDMPYGDLLANVFMNLNTYDLAFLFAFLVPFIPILFKSAKSSARHNKIVFTIISAMVALAIIAFSGLPHWLHDCDSKGSDADLLVITNPILFSIISISLILLARFFTSPKKAK